MIKPDGVQRAKIGEIVTKFEERGFVLLAMKICSPSREVVTQHYEDLQDKPFFNGLVEYVLSAPVCCMVW